MATSGAALRGENLDVLQRRRAAPFWFRMTRRTPRCPPLDVMESLAYWRQMTQCRFGDLRKQLRRW